MFVLGLQANSSIASNKLQRSTILTIWPEAFGSSTRQNGNGGWCPLVTIGFTGNKKKTKFPSSRIHSGFFLKKIIFGEQWQVTALPIFL